MEPRSAADFIEIAKQFSTVLVDVVPALDDDLRDPTRRFIYLVDEFYDRRVKLLVRAEQSILELYQEKNWLLRLNVHVRVCLRCNQKTTCVRSIAPKRLRSGNGC